MVLTCLYGRTGILVLVRTILLASLLVEDVVGDISSLFIAGFSFQEGFRFNALHIAARHGKANVVRRILELVSDIDFLAAVYGTSREDAQFRAENIVTSYLNTPDKVALLLNVIFLCCWTTQLQNSRAPSFTGFIRWWAGLCPHRHCTRPSAIHTTRKGKEFQGVAHLRVKVPNCSDAGASSLSSVYSRPLSALVLVLYGFRCRSSDGQLGLHL